MTDESYVNCRYCGSKIPFFTSNCFRCGAPNSPEPLPWYTSMGQRLKSSLVSNTESVWADLLVNLMPIHFAFALYTFYLGVKLGLMGTLGFFAVLVSAFVILYILMYYPDWYKEGPEKRKNSGVIYFIVLLAYALVAIMLF